jgi:hypothetical protein
MRGFNEKLFGDKLVAGQLPTQLGLIGSQEVFDIDTDAQAFFDRVTAAGGTLSATEKTAVDTLVKQMKLDGIWTPMKAIYPMVGASAAACAQNLKSSSFTGTFTSGFTFASTGVTPNGTSAYMDTSFVPFSQLTIDNAHLSYYSRTQLSKLLDQPFRASTGLGDIQISPNINGAGFTFFASVGGITSATATNLDSRGFFISSRISKSSQNGFKNNSVIATNSASGTITLPNVNLYIGAANVGGSANNFSILQCAFASIGDGLTDTQASDLYTAVQAFQTTLSRQV